MMKIKSTASIAGLKPEMVMAAMIVKDIYDYYNIDFVITSGTDGEHSKNSLHYVGFAFDCRTYTIPTDTLLHTMFAEIKEALGVDYDVVIESTHIHIEFQPEVHR